MPLDYCISFSKEVVYRAVVILLVVGYYTLEARVITTGNDFTETKVNTIQSDKRDLVRLFKQLEIASFVPSAVGEKDVLTYLNSQKPITSESHETSDEDEFDIIFYISPALLEQLTGGPGYRITKDSKGRYNSDAKNT